MATPMRMRGRKPDVCSLVSLIKSLSLDAESRSGYYRAQHTQWPAVYYIIRPCRQAIND
jgi:hypothetical protein